MDLKRKRIGVLMGGLSRERAVSLKSGENVYAALVRQGYRAIKVEISSANELIPRLAGIDIGFICLHGGLGEDGTIQALLEVLAIPYTGSPVLASALAMNKPKAKQVFKACGLPTSAWREPDGDLPRWKEKVEEELGYPLVVKPVAEGSSLGVRIVKDPADFETACQETQKQFGRFFVEKHIPGKEITVGILRINGKDTALPPIELRPRLEFYNYEAKYVPGATEFIIPAELDEKTSTKVKELSLKAHQALGCFGFSRVDLRVTPQDDIYLLEVNTIPGMTETSDLPKAAAAAGINFEQLVEYMLKTAIEKSKV